jgi:demethylmenaquinone methyltransferase/2-methoxy-6-polyprenyl-1,4-benzoquinol methylase
MQEQRQSALSRYRLIAPMYGAVAPLNRRLREEAVRGLALKAGDTVLDIGCGTGLSFDLLQRRIGPTGRLIGVELSPHMLMRARELVADRGWSNVTLLEASADEAEIDAQADAALLFFTHDILQSEPAIDNVLAHVTQGARVISAGGRGPDRWWQFPGNMTYLAYWPFVTTNENASQPWAKLEPRLSRFRREDRLLGAAYVAWGEKRAP